MNGKASRRLLLIFPPRYTPRALATLSNLRHPSLPPFFYCSAPGVRCFPPLALLFGIVSPFFANRERQQQLHHCRVSTFEREKEKLKQFTTFLGKSLLGPFGSIRIWPPPGHPPPNRIKDATIDVTYFNPLKNANMQLLLKNCFMGMIAIYFILRLVNINRS